MKNADVIEGDSWFFIHATDMQPGSPKSFRFKQMFLDNWRTARRQIVDLAPELMIVGGDVTRDGSIHKWELEEMKADFDGMGIDYHVIPGNMDTGNKHADRDGPREDRRDPELNVTPEQIHQFESVFGPSKWSFIHKNVRFSGFCDMLINSGLPEEEALWDWFEELKNLPRAQHHLWFIHYAMFMGDVNEPNFDITDPEQYMDWYFSIDNPGRRRLMDVFKATGTTRVISAHIHCRKDHVAEGIHFDLAPGIAMGQYGARWPDGDDALGFLRYDVNGDEMTKTFIPLETVSASEDGYGPGGHVMPENRDYSLAWEK